MRFAVKLLQGMALLAVVLSIAWWLSEPKALPADTSSAQLLEPGPYPVGSMEFELEDTSRTTAANGEFAELPLRKLQLRAWFPRGAGDKEVAKQAFALVVYSHGYFGNNAEARYLAEYLASHGYVFVAANYPLTNYQAPGGPNFFDVVNQPGDVSFVIDTMLTWNAQATHAFHGRIDAARIALAGLSLGGLTTELASYHPKLREQRARAAVSIAGPLQMFGREFFADSQLPFMMIAGDVDAMVPYDSNALPVLERINNAWLVSISRGSHTGFADQASWLRWFDNPDSLGCSMIAGETPKMGDGPDMQQLFGGAQIGILNDVEDRFCVLDPLPDSVSPLLQQRVVMLAVRGFLESVFNPQASEQERYRDYLRSTLGQELDGVTVERSAPPLAAAMRAAVQER